MAVVRGQTPVVQRPAQGQVSNALANLKMNAGGPDVFQLQGSFLTDQLALVPRLVVLNVFHFSVIFG